MKHILLLSISLIMFTQCTRKTAYFSEEYKQNYRNRTVVEIPKVYELVNIIIALTSSANEKKSNLIRADIPYYQEVTKWFAPYRKHSAVLKADSLLRQHSVSYFILKMDSYIYKFDKENIVHKGIYNGIANDGGRNMMPPELLYQIEKFSEISNFNQFYDNHKSLYQSQIDYYKNKVNISQMQRWLNSQFPNISYDCFRVIFSPLVAWNQSAAWFNNNGFKEAQAHVNFPYPSEADKSRTAKENELLDGQILFTEFNHAYNNPTTKRYFKSKDFKKTFLKDMNFWAVEKSIAAKSYYTPELLFNEYMNWSLVSLYLLDHTSIKVAEKMIESIEYSQYNKRGFKQFKAFNQNLINEYKNKKEGETVADLYPAVVNWCKEFNTENN